MDSRPRSGAAPATVTGEFRPFMPLDVIREGGAGTVTREPGDLPDADVLCADGVCRAKRGYHSYDDAVGVAGEASRSEERRVGKECVSTCRSGWLPYHYNNKQLTRLSHYVKHKSDIS